MLISILKSIYTSHLEVSTELSLDGIQTGKSNYTAKKNSGLLLSIPQKKKQKPETNRLS